AGCAVTAGGLWFPASGWLRPAALIGAQLARAKSVRLHAGREVAKLDYREGRWIARGDGGTEIAAAPVCVLANASDAPRLAALGASTLKQVRGQVTRLPAGSCKGLAAVIAGPGYLVPSPDGIIAGASYDFDDTDPAPRASGHAGNLARLAQLVAAPPSLDP